MPPPEQVMDESNCPLEFLNAIPMPIKCFANELVESRALAANLEVPHISLGDLTSQLRFEGAFDQFADVPGYGDWVNWLAHWLSRFGRLSDAAAVSLRMSHSRHPTCPRFHVDAVRMRLIATLVGPGTEWLRSENVTRATDGRIGQTPEPDTVQQIAPGSVGLFKGAAFDDIPGRGVVHRSPPDRVDRVVMTVDIAA